MVKLGIVFGFCVGFMFIGALKSLIREIKYRRRAKRCHKPYIKYLVDENIPSTYTVIGGRIGLSWLINSRIFAFLSCLIKIVLILISIALLILLLYANEKGYSEFFNYRW